MSLLTATDLVARAAATFLDAPPRPDGVDAGHLPSEQAGMSLFAERLAEVVPEVPVSFLATGDLLRSV
ncbi:hypothetical protein ACNHYB_11575 [Isoptericola jiangsuensis]|uniref:hypothetical protein n=1 Tax=Isoptericola jiangsuensis TaxID=548579 RepID=UPI003AAFB151